MYKVTTWKDQSEEKVILICFSFVFNTVLKKLSRKPAIKV